MYLCMQNIQHVYPCVHVLPYDIILEVDMLGQRMYQSAEVGYAAVTNNSKNLKTTKDYFPLS